MGVLAACMVTDKEENEDIEIMERSEEIVQKDKIPASFPILHTPTLL